MTSFAASSGIRVAFQSPSPQQPSGPSRRVHAVATRGRLPVALSWLPGASHYSPTTYLCPLDWLASPLDKLWRFHLFLASWSSNSQEDQNGAIQPHHILVSKAANTRPDFCFWNRRDLIHHQATNSSESVGLARLNEESKKRSIGWIGSERAQRNRIRHVETVVLKNHHRTWLSSVVLTARNGPDLAALHVPPQSEMASIKSWSSFACGLLATARDCLWASATKEGERMSGTQIWMGRKPCCRNRLRCALTLSRDDLDRLRAPMSTSVTGYM